MVQQRVIALFVFAALMWMFEIIPNWTTSLLGFLVVIAVFSMFMSNTATAAMMLAFLAPVLSVLPADDKGKVGLALAIPVAANLGGIGTPIGTPPNAIAASTGLVETKDMAKVGALVGVIGFVLGFFWLTKFFPF